MAHEDFCRGEYIKILYIGRSDMYHKGLDLLLEAVKIEKEFMKQNKCKLYIHGPDFQDRRAELMQAVQSNNIEDLVEINNAIIGKEKEERILECDYFIQTSRFEGMPMGILEALSYGLPCIVTEGTTLADFVKTTDSGWVCETNSQSIASAICRAIGERRLLSEKSKNAIESVKKQFSWEVVSSSTIEKYKSLIENK